MKALVVANPNAGGARRAASLDWLEDRLRGYGLAVHRIVPSPPAHIAEALRRALREESPEETRVIAVGGDGTINALLPALMGTGVPLAVLPAGTLNALAGELGIPRAGEEALRVAVYGRPRRIDLGLANGRPFAQMAGLGFDGAVVHSVVPAECKNMLSPGAIARGLRLLTTYAPTHFQITTAEATVEVEAWLALVANASRYTYRLRIAPGARVDDGWLDVWLFQRAALGRAVRQVIALLRGGEAVSLGVRHLRARSLRVESEPPVFLHLDGDPAGGTPAEIGIAPRALTVVSPVHGWARDSSEAVSSLATARPAAIVSL